MRFRTSLLLLAMTAAPVALRANPRILVQDPPAGIIITNDSFTFGADALGGGVFSFQNKSGHDWHQMDVTATLPIFTEITVGPGVFITDTVSVKPVTGGFFYDIRFGPTATGGILNGASFLVNLDSAGSDPNGPGEWGKGRDFGAQANDTPEPASSLLFLAGGLLVAGVFRFRRLVA